MTRPAIRVTVTVMVRVRVRISVVSALGKASSRCAATISLCFSSSTLSREMSDS